MVHRGSTARTTNTYGPSLYNAAHTTRCSSHHIVARTICAVPRIIVRLAQRAIPCVSHNTCGSSHHSTIRTTRTFFASSCDSHECGSSRQSTLTNQKRVVRHHRVHTTNVIILVGPIHQLTLQAVFSPSLAHTTKLRKKETTLGMTNNIHLALSQDQPNPCWPNRLLWPYINHV